MTSILILNKSKKYFIDQKKFYSLMGIDAQNVKKQKKKKMKGKK